MKKYLLTMGLLLLVMLIFGCDKYPTGAEQYKSCTITQTKMLCPDGTEYDLPVDGRDGLDGADGEDGVDGMDGAPGTIIAVYDPCGDKLGHPDEVLLLFDDGSILAWYLDLGFTVLIEGVQYVTTDKQKCEFMVLNGEVIEL